MSSDGPLVPVDEPLPQADAGSFRLPRQWPVSRTASWRWTAAVLVIALGAVAAFLVPQADRALGWTNSFGVSPSAAQAGLAAISGGMITLTGFALTALTLVIQTVQAQSPRLLGASDRLNTYPVVFGAFIATFLYALLVLLRLRDDEVPALSLLVAVLAVLCCIGLFLMTLMHLRSNMTVGGLARGVGEQTRRVIEGSMPLQSDPSPALDPDTRSEPGPSVRISVVAINLPGVLQGFREQALVQLAERHGAVISLIPTVGDFVVVGSVLAVVDLDGGTTQPATAAELSSTVSALIALGPIRTIEQDPAYGIRLLVDVAIRALSPAVNDPTSAVQVLDQLEDLLSRLGRRSLGNGRLVDGAGVVRVRFPAPPWDAYVSLALDEIRLYGSGSLQVTRRMRAMLVDLMAVLPPERRAVLTERLRDLDATVSGFALPADRARAATADRQGLGGVGPTLPDSVRP